MSQQERYASLADAINPSESARIHLASLKRYLPDVAKGLDDTMKSASVREVHGMLIVESSEYINEGTALALFLNWIIKSRPATVTANIANQMAGMAARVFDYPEIRKNAIAQFQSKKRLGRGRDDRISPDDRGQAIKRALKRKGSEDRSIVVSDLASELDLKRSTVSKILAGEGWPGKKGPPNKTN